MKWLMRIVLFILAGIALWQIKERFFVSDETRIRRQLTKMTQAVERANLLQLEGCIAGDYSDDHGLDKSSLLVAVRTYRSQYTSLFIVLSDLTIQVQPDHQKAQAAFIAKALAKPPGGMADTELFTERFRLDFRKTDRVWKLYRAESPKLKFD